MGKVTSDLFEKALSVITFGRFNYIIDTMYSLFYGQHRQGVVINDMLERLEHLETHIMGEACAVCDARKRDELFEKKKSETISKPILN
jgi:hypothetical protein